MKFKRTTAVNRILAMKTRVKVIQGGTSAGKTIAILGILIDRATKQPLLESSVVAATYPQLRRGAMKDFIKLMKMTGRFNPDRWHGTDCKYTFENGSYIEFFSADDEFKVRGARRHILFINEANRIHFSIFHQLSARTAKDVYVDYNPTSRFWAHEEVDTDSNTSMLKLTYLDNEARPENVDAEMKKAKRLHDQGDSPYWINFWKVFGLGEIGSTLGSVWTDWSIIDSLPTDEKGVVIADLLGFGTDFGYSISSTAVIAIYKYEGKYIFDEWIHDTKLTNKDIAEMMMVGGYGGEMMYCDSAEPKTIDALQRLGINAFPCANKSDIRQYAIDKIGSEHFHVTANSKSTISDLENYVWQENKTGEYLPKPKKQNDHAPDAMIYFIGTEDKYDGRYISYI